ncbi:MAG: hypothetical protein AB8B83_08170 [Bdellovibrionales bacterium]
MFWNKDKKSQNKKGTKNKTSDKRGKASCVGNKDSGGHGLTGDALRAKAMANVRSARAHIGEDTLDKIAAAMTKKQQSAMERAKRDIQGADVDKVLDELKWMLDSKN